NDRLGYFRRPVTAIRGGHGATHRHDERREPDEIDQWALLDAYAPAARSQVLSQGHQQVAAAVHLDGGLGRHLALRPVAALLRIQNGHGCPVPRDDDRTADTVVVRALDRLHAVEAILIRPDRGTRALGQRDIALDRE